MFLLHRTSTVFRPNLMHSVHNMRPNAAVTWSVGLFVGLSVREPCKTAETIEMPFWG